MANGKAINKEMKNKQITNMKKLLLLAVLILTITSCTKTGTSIITPTPLIKVDSGLVAYYPFNGNANDSSSLRNNGLAYNTASTSNKKGISGRAYYFNGTNSSITIPKPFFNGTKIEVFSLALDFYLDQLPTDSTYSYTLWGKDGFWQNLELKVNSKGQILLGGSVPDKYQTAISNIKQVQPGKWYSLVVKYSKTGCNFYLNNTQIDINASTFDFTGTLVSNTMAGFVDFGQTAKMNSNSSNLFGASNSAQRGNYNFLKGRISNFRLYSRLLTDSEITYLYNN